MTKRKLQQPGTSRRRRTLTPEEKARAMLAELTLEDRAMVAELERRLDDVDRGARRLPEVPPPAVEMDFAVLGPKSNAAKYNIPVIRAAAREVVRLHPTANVRQRYHELRRMLKTRGFDRKQIPSDDHLRDLVREILRT
jgi:hypothetical protein